MKTVAIKDKNTIKKIKDEYLKKGWLRDLILFELAINSGTKLVYLLNLKVSAIKEKDFLNIRDCSQTYKIFRLNNEIKNLVKRYCEKSKETDFLFPSTHNPNKHIDRIEVFRKFKTICETLGLDEKYSIASWRKTFGYHYYKEFKDLTFLQSWYGQNTPTETLKYIGVNENINNRLNLEFCL